MTRRAGRVVAAIVSGILFQSVAMSATPSLDERQTEFAVPAQPLALALMEYGRQAGLTIAAPAELTNGRTSTAITGRRAPESALRELLQGTGLGYRFISATAVKIERATRAPSTRPAAAPATDATPRSDEGDAQEVLVTANRREQRLADVPAAVTALDSARLEQIGFTNLRDLGDVVPSLSFARPQNGASGALFIFIRGIGQVTPDNVSRDPGVGIYLDDVYLARGTASSVDLGDIERVEVLRGPQGVLYGRNAVGGAVKFITAKPSGKFEVGESLDVGNFGLWRTLTSLNLPEWNGVSAKLSYMRSGYDGWADNPGTGGEFGERDQQGVRAAFRWRPGAGVVADYVYDHNTQRGIPAMSQHGYGASTVIGLPANPGRVDRSYRPVDWPLQDDYTTFGHALTIDVPLGEATNIKSISSYRSLDSQLSTDTVEAYVFSGFGINASAYYRNRQHQLSQELLLTGGSELKYSLGAFYFHESAGRFDGSANTVFFQPTVVVPLTPADLKFSTSAARNASWGMYASFDWTPPLGERRLDLSLGGRFSQDRREASGGAVIFSTQTADSSSFDPSFTAAWRWNESVRTYVKYSTAYRAGGFNTGNEVLREFDPENIRAYELGLKSRSPEGALGLNVDAFVQNYDNIQLDQNLLTGEPPEFRVVTTNAGKARIRGVELELEARPVRALHLSLQATRLDGDSLSVEPVPLPLLPKWKYDAGAEYQFGLLGPGQLSTSLNWSYSGSDFSYQTLTDSPRPGRRLLSARLGLADIAVGGGRATLALWGRNLTNEAYQESHVSGGVSIGEPRAFGINARYSR